MKQMADKMAKWYEIKVRAIMGPDAADDKEVRILNRLIRWEGHKITYAADDKHVARRLCTSSGSTMTPKGSTRRSRQG